MDRRGGARISSSRGLTNAEMGRAANYTAGDTVIFNRPYKTLGVEKGDERAVARVDHKRNRVFLRDGKGNQTEWQPWRIAGAKGGVEVYRSEGLELRAGDRVRWTRNDPVSGLANGQAAVVDSVARDGVRFRLEDGSVARLAEGDPQLRHMDRAWAATVHAFQGRSVDRIVAAMPSGHPHLTNQRSFYVAISRARDRAELVTDDAWRLADHLQKATGERVSALDAVAKRAAHEAVFGRDSSLERDTGGGREGRDALERGYGGGRQLERSLERERRPGREHGRSSPERSAGRHGTDRGPSNLDRGTGQDRSAAREPQRSPGHAKAPKPKQKSVDLDLGL